MSLQNMSLDTEGISVKESFFSRFGNEQRSLQEQIERLKDTSVPEVERLNLVDSCLSGISHLTNEVKDASSYLPAYDQRTYSTAIKTLSEKLQSARSVSAPKRKFAFRKSVPGKGPARDTPASSAAQDSRLSPSGGDATFGSPKATFNAPSASDERHQNTVFISSLSSCHHVLHEDALRLAASVIDVNHSFIDLSASMTLARPFSTLTIRSVTESLLVCGQVSGAAHVTGVEKSTLIIWSRQVRIHECKDCVVYLRCSSRPIIEDCHGIRFAPLQASFCLPSSEAPIVLPPNLWDQVDDFKWLRAEHSPNWSVLQPDDARAIDGEGWEKITAGEGSQLDLDSLLRAGKILI